MEKRFLLAIALSFIVLMFWKSYIMPPSPPAPEDDLTLSSPVPEHSLLPTQSGTAGEIRSGVTAGEDGDILPEPFEATPVPEERIITIRAHDYVAVLTSHGAHVTSWTLPEYSDEFGEPLEMISPLDPRYYPGDIRIGESDAANTLMYEIQELESEFVLDETRTSATIHFTARTLDSLVVEKTMTFHFDKFMVDLTLDIDHISARKTGDIVSVVLPETILVPMENGTTNRFIKSGPVLMLSEDREEPKIKKLTSRWVYNESVSWAAVQESFFFMGLVPAAGMGKAFVEPVMNGTPDKKPEKAFVGIQLGTWPLREAEKSVHLIIGPKKYNRLEDLEIGIENIVDFGWITVLGKMFYHVIISVNHVVHNYGLSIIFLTIAIKLILFPLSHISMKSMKKMQVIQPQMKEIQERYRKDPRKQQAEMTKLYRKHGANPMSGCLPLFIQFPVFIALYQMLMNLIEMRGAAFLWAGDLSQPDIALVLIMGASMIVQQKMTPTTGDPRQAKMMMFLPIIFTAMFWNFPSGLVLYWLTNNILTITQQYFMHIRPGKDDEDEEPRVKARTQKKLGDLKSAGHGGDDEQN